MAAAYDQYAPALYGLLPAACLASVLDAADAVQDTFIVAAYALLGGSAIPAGSGPGSMPWPATNAAAACAPARRPSRSMRRPELTDDTIDLSAEAEKAELRALVSSALAGLNPGTGRSSS